MNRTQARFGYQWTHFDQLTPEFEEHFHAYLGPMEPSEFSGKLVLDAGCGYGRYALYAQRFGARVVGMDFSEAVWAAREAVRGQGISLVQGDLLRPPFRRGSFDLVMSLGVLHHLPDPRLGFEQLSRLVDAEGAMVVWLYSARRKISNAVVEILRRMARPLPNSWLRWISLALAIPDFAISKVFRSARPLVGVTLWNRLIPTHFRLYGKFPLRVCWADWFDRLGAPIRHYHTHEELQGWLQSAGAGGSISATEDFGWTLIARFAPGQRRSAEISR